MSALALFKIIRTAETGVYQRFGKFIGTAGPGINFKIPLIDTIVSVSNRLEQSTFEFEAKTRDNVFTTLGIAVQHKIKPENTERAFFSLDDPHYQINSFVKNVIRARVPKMDVQELFVKQDEIAQAVREDISDKMEEHGFTIHDVLVTAIDPDSRVKDKLNAVQAAKLAQDASEHEGEAQKILKVKEAEADRDRRILQGQGISGQRMAILEGYRDSIEMMSSDLKMEPGHLVEFITRMQELDTMESFSKSQGTNTVFYPRGENTLTNELIKANRV